MVTTAAKHPFVYAAVALLAVLMLTLTGSSAVAQDRQAMGITVSGHGEVIAAPDIAYVSLGVMTRDVNAQKAATENARIAQAITNAMKAQGIDEKDIQTVNYSIQPVMEYPQNQQPRLVGYEVRNTVRVTVRNITKIGSVIDAGIKAGSNEVQGISFEVANDRALRQEALAAAVNDARQQAEVIARSLGVKLGSPIQVTETSYRPPVPLFRGGATMEAASAPTPISPGQLTVSEDVTVTWAILP